MLYYQIGYIMQVTMGTTPVESVVAAGTIFLGQVNKEEKIVTSITQRRFTRCVKCVFFSLSLVGVSDPGPSVHRQVDALGDPHVNDSGLGRCLWHHACCVPLPRGEESSFV